jgi:transcription elongation GreA/GreB family factor
MNKLSYQNKSNMKEKVIILEMLRSKVKDQLREAEIAYEKTAEYTKSEELKAESKYDTRGVEAGMLAGAQRRRVDELKQDLELLDSIPIHEENKNDIQLGSIVELEMNRIKRKYFLSSCAGGTMLEINGEAILVISVFSPMGIELIGLKAQDSFTLEINSGIRDYSILSIS